MKKKEQRQRLNVAKIAKESQAQSDISILISSANVAFVYINKSFEYSVYSLFSFNFQQNSCIKQSNEAK